MDGALYEVLKRNIFTNDILFKIGYISSPNCSFCLDTTETRNHVLLSDPFSYSLMDVSLNILKDFHGSCNGLLPQDMIVGILQEGWM